MMWLPQASRRLDASTGTVEGWRDVGLSYNAKGVIIFALFGLYGAMILFTFIRARQAQRRYLHELPPVDGVPLEMYWGGGPRSVTRELLRALREPQGDPGLEQLRHESRRRMRIHMVWGSVGVVVWFGMALLVFLVPLTH
jgi:hypothetical protein